MCVVPLSVSGYITSKSIVLGLSIAPGTSRLKSELSEFATVTEENVDSSSNMVIDTDALKLMEITYHGG